MLVSALVAIGLWQSCMDKKSFNLQNLTFIQTMHPVANPLQSIVPSGTMLFKNQSIVPNFAMSIVIFAGSL